MIPFSVLDLCPVNEGSIPADSFRHSLALAQTAERLGYSRFWLAEHHNMEGIASAATAVVMGHIASGTTSIRVGAGGIMLPNHSPLVIAEQFGTLESLFPSRIDLGLGRAPGSDMATARALRRDGMQNAESFPRDVLELQSYFAIPDGTARIRAVPGEGLQVPLWLLGSSLYSAQLAAALGLPFAFAAHFAPDYLPQALEVYRHGFRPSAQLQTPYAMIAVNVIAARDDQEAARIFTSQQQAFLNLRRGRPGKLPAPVDDLSAICSQAELDGVNQALRYSFVGAGETVKTGLEAFIDRFRPDEVMVTGHIHDQKARLRSYELVAEITGIR